ncbi:hypothetical protein GGH94_003750 [Coemansia aciculifera]|uniref:Uncharacterized protein n=1 Tax=Coemansia aciculifera TaxID=417176 RepID=A0A9W8M4R6_9FUNG|nr:hypothetical protein GGH94_003750 [Coemansia aciculifera]
MAAIAVVLVADVAIAAESVVPEIFSREAIVTETIAIDEAIVSTHSSAYATFVDTATRAAADAYGSASTAVLSADTADGEAVNAKSASRAARAADIRAFNAEVNLSAARDEVIPIVSPAKHARGKASAAVSDSRAAAHKAGFYADASADAADLTYAAMADTVAAAAAGDPVAAAKGAKAAVKAAADAKLAAANAADAANKASVWSATAISARTDAEEIADSVEARAAVAIAEAKAAIAALVGISAAKPLSGARTITAIVRPDSNPDDIFLESDFPPFGMEEVLRGCHNDAASLGYLLGESEKARKTMAKFEERFEAFQGRIYEDCEWVSGGRYFKMEDMIRARCYELNCLR